jgi:hypothetical protein
MGTDDDDGWSEKTEAEIRVLSNMDLVRGLFATTSTVCAPVDLTRFRAMSTEDLFNGLIDEDPQVNGGCKAVLAEQMQSAGIDDIVSFVFRHDFHLLQLSGVDEKKMS